MKLLTLLLFLSSLLFGDSSLKIATYNVENLFDLHKSGHEYKEYIPNTRSNWNKHTYTIKLKHIARVIKDIDADIIALEEIESIQALKDLRYTLKRMGLYYQYYKIANSKKTTVKVAILSKIPFSYTKEIPVTQSYKYRNILEAKFNIKGQRLYLLVNHWKSKSGPESMRIVSAKALFKRTQEIGKNKNIIALGDFNSDYEEYKRFQHSRRLNNTGGITGINHVLGTINYQHNTATTNMQAGLFYNLWYDITPKERFSYIYHGKKEAMDNILVSKALLNNKGIEYKEGSIHSFQKPYLFKGRYIYHWQTSRSKLHYHYGKGYSDHLPVIAEFTIHSDTN